MQKQQEDIKNEAPLPPKTVKKAKKLTLAAEPPKEESQEELPKEEPHIEIKVDPPVEL